MHDGLLYKIITSSQLPRLHSIVNKVPLGKPLKHRDAKKNPTRAEFYESLTKLLFLILSPHCLHFFESYAFSYIHWRLERLFKNCECVIPDGLETNVRCGAAAKNTVQPKYQTFKTCCVIRFLRDLFMLHADCESSIKLFLTHMKRTYHWDHKYRKTNDHQTKARHLVTWELEIRNTYYTCYALVNQLLQTAMIILSRARTCKSWYLHEYLTNDESQTRDISLKCTCCGHCNETISRACVELCLVTSWPWPVGFSGESPMWIRSQTPNPRCGYIYTFFPGPSGFPRP